MTARGSRKAPYTRQSLLKLLRQQARQLEGCAYYSRDSAPELFDLAMAADAAPRGRSSFIFGGVRFTMKFGFRRYVIDPSTGETLCGGKFLA